MKKLLSITVLMITLTLLVGCSRFSQSDPDPIVEPEPEEGEVIPITFWNPITGADGVEMRSLIRDFNEEYEGEIQVSETYVNETTHYQNIDLLVPMGRGPDIAIMHSHRVPGYVEKDLVISIDDYISNSDISTDDYVDSVMESLIIDDDIYGIPFDLHTVGIYYNSDLLEKYNLDVPTTRQELIQAATTVQDGENNANFYGFPISTAWPSEWLFTTALYQNGGNEISDAETPSFNNDAGVAALKAVADLIHTYQLSPNTMSVDQDLFAFQQGNALFHVQGSWMLNAIMDSSVGNSFGVMPMSAMFTDEDTENKNEIYARSHTFVFPKTQKIPSEAKQEAMMTFVKWMGDHSYEWATAGQIPASNIARENQNYIDLPYIHDFGDTSNFRMSAQTPYYQEVFGVSYAYVTQALSISPSNVNEDYTDEKLMNLLNDAVDEAALLVASVKG